MWSDTLSSVGVIAAGAIIFVTGRTIADPIISIIIGVLILRGAGGLVWESINILLEAVPKNLDVSRINDAIRKIKGVRDIHDVHLWAITSGMYAMSCHLLIEDQMVSNCTQIVDEVNRMLSQEFGISHSTVQLECEECENSPVCHIGGEHEI
jgi:cobalt-zinc-cadmium efflux system protein